MSPTLPEITAPHQVVVIYADRASVAEMEGGQWVTREHVGNLTLSTMDRAIRRLAKRWPSPDRAYIEAPIREPGAVTFEADYRAATNPTPNED